MDVATAQAKIRQARASYWIAGGSGAPQISVSGAETGTAQASNLGDVSNGFRAGFDASWETDLFGSARRGKQAAWFGLGAAKDQLDATLVTLIGDVTADYVEARGYQARIAQTKATLRSLRQTLQITRDKVKAGSASDLDLANITGQVASTQATLPDLETGYGKTVHALALLAGETPEKVSATLGSSVVVPVPRLPIPAGVPADVLTARPDVRAAERALAQSTAKIGVAEAARYPDISLSGTISTAASSFGALARMSNVSLNLGPSISIPLFEGGKFKASVALAKAQRDQAYIAWRQSVLGALRDVEDATTALSQDRSRISSLKRSLSAYETAEKLTMSLYNAGSATFLDLLSAERALYSAQTGLIEARTTFASDYVALNKALGGGWDGKIGAGAPIVKDGPSGPHRAPAPPPQSFSHSPARK